MLRGSSRDKRDMNKVNGAMSEQESTGKSSRWKWIAVALFLTTLAVIQFIPGPDSQGEPPTQNETQMESNTSPSEPDIAIEPNGEDSP